jgi:ABC-2 type transport system ATP-binding protein
LLDEVEKTCDHVAIVDQGRVVVQGSIDELRGEDGQELLVAVSDVPRARTLLAAQKSVGAVVDNGGMLRVTLRDADAIPDLNRLLVESGLDVYRLEPSQASLEQRFLEVTTRLENAA